VAVHLAALRAHADGVPVGVTVLVEGEEEIGSPALPGFLDAFSGALRADVVVFADAGNWTEDIPALTTSLRGGPASWWRCARCATACTAACTAARPRRADRAVPDAGQPARRARRRGGARPDLGDADPLDLTEEQFRAEAGMLDGVRLTGTAA